MLAAPSLAGFAPVNVPAGTTMHIRLDGSDTDIGTAAGDALTYTVAYSSGDSSIVPTVLSGDRSLRMDTSEGIMEFYLFEDDAPRVTSRILALAQQNFYNNTIFHRVIEDFVIQGGDPQGTGSGGSGTKFDDQFNDQLRHTSSGLLSMAKTTDDTNDSQFFITDAATRHLDFNHSIFGFLTAGEDVRDEINSVPTNAADKPLTDVKINSMTVFTDVENGVLRISVPEGAPVDNSAIFTVTVRDRAGATQEKILVVNVVADTRPAITTPSYIPYTFLLPTPELVASPTSPQTFTLRARVVEPNLPVKFGFSADATKVNVQLSNTGNVTPVNGIATVTVTLTPTAAAIGQTVDITFFVQDPDLQTPFNPSNSNDFATFSSKSDLQVKRLTVIQGAPASDTVGLYLSTTDDFFLRNSLSSGPADTEFKQAPATDGAVALAGDWDGNGSTTYGFYNPTTGKFDLRNSNTAGTADISIQYGPGGNGWVPVVGDWNGDGKDTVGLYNQQFSVFFLKNDNTAGAGEYIFHYGPAGQNWVPIAGDWDGDGVDTVGLYKPSASEFFLRNRDDRGIADVRYVFGATGQGLLPVMADWNNDGIDTAGLFAPTSNTFFLRNANSGGTADVTFSFGPAGLGFVPLAGDWGGSTGLTSATATAGPDTPPGFASESDDELAGLAAAALGDSTSDSPSADQVDEVFASDEPLDDMLI